MKLLRSRKALSPVVASIILIAVTVAVSIAVAAWMGALSGMFMGSAENLNVGNPWGWNLSPTSGDYVYVNVTNNGGSSLVITSVRIGNDQATFEVDFHSDPNTPAAVPLTLAPGESAGLKIIYTGKNFTAGVPYIIKLITSSNREFSTQGIPPG